MLFRSPSNLDTIDFQLYDKDKLSSDLVATLRLSIKDLDEQLEKVPSLLQWYNLYGCNPDKDNDAAKEQN